MEGFLVTHQAALHNGLFFGAFVVIALWESAAPRRILTAPIQTRWLCNIAITLLSLGLIYTFFHFTGVDFVLYAADQQWGLLALVDLPYTAELIIGLILLDLSRYFSHWTLHHVPILWRLHRIHHSDHDYDITTGLRFHPLEALYVVVYDLAVLFILGAPLLAVILYRLVNAVMAVFAHANAYIPAQADRWLRLALVTPDVHRIHHSAKANETNSNFGSITPWWDRLFGTYIDQPKGGHEHMTVGLLDYRDQKYLRLGWMLMHPFQKKYR